MPSDALAARLADHLGAAHVLTDPGLRATYETDWTGRFTGHAQLVARPADTAEVVALVHACRSAGAAIVTQGGNTGLVGGSVPRGGEVVASTTRLDGLGDVDAASAQVTVGAGATLAAVADHARAEGLDVGVDLAARDSATIGGMVATNAGGVRVVRHGMMRAQVAGVEAVLADGSVISRLHGLAKDNTGYDLDQLLVGSEGTLGIVTAVRLRLVPHLRKRVVVLVGLPDLGAAVALLPRLREHAPSLDAVEYADAGAVALVREHAGLPAPLAGDHGVYLFVEVAARHDPIDEIGAALGDEPAIAIGVDRGDRESLWAYREGITEAVNAAGVPRKLDVAVPLAELEAVAGRIRGLVARTGGMLALFGHLADGNLHVNVTGLDDVAADRLEEAVLRAIADAGGTVSAEHGIGVAKTQWLGLSRSPAEITAMRTIKQALDPDGLLNPGVLLT